ncbi:MAG: rhodanese-like domain-containing protein [Balneolaceae bacterium]|nr:rhodanese-like domain-containing protein [Balneolaceae bacterium]
MADTLTIQRTTAEVLFDKMNSNERPVLLNALDHEAYIAKRIPGSINVPVDNADLIEDIVPDKEQDIVVYCANKDCDASPKLAEKLMEKGYTRVWDFEDGLAGWRKEGYELSGQEVE